MKAALLLVDLQNDHLDRAGLQPRPAPLVRRAAVLLEGCRRHGVPVIHGRTTVVPGDDRRMPHWKATGRWSCVTGTPGHEAPGPLRALPGELAADKRGFSVFEDPGLGAALGERGCETLIVAGVCLHACVRAAVLDAHGRGFGVVVAEDAVASDDPLHAAVTRRYLEDRGVAFRPVARILESLPRWLAGNVDDLGEDPPLAHRSPRDQREVLFTLREASVGEIRGCAAAARDASAAWRATPPGRRRALVLELARAIEGAGPGLVQMLVEHVGKPVGHAEGEVAFGASLLKCAAGHADDAGTADGCRTGQRRVPVGTVAVISPWNNPVAVPLGKLAPALLFGNAVVWKPAPAGLAIAERVRELLLGAGCPADLVRIVPGGAITARRLAAEPGIDAVTVTGSLQAGWAIQEICARRSVPVQGELGGNNAAIVWADAALDDAAAAVARGAFGAAGQRCTANRRVVVDERCHDDFVGRLARAAAGLGWGDPRERSCEVGPLISAEKRDELAAAVADARAAGWRVVVPHGTGGPRAGCPEHGAYLPPTIVCCDDPADPLVQDESFGPILVVQRARGFPEAVELVNGVPQGLAAALFSASAERRGIFLRDVRAGVLKIGQSTAGADPGLPFGGWKASGIGPPEHGASDREFHTRAQAVYCGGGGGPCGAAGAPAPAGPGQSRG